MSKRNLIEDQHYSDWKTGEIIESVKMRIFQVLHKGYWITIRHYVLADEAKLNPGFGKSPQMDNAFPLNGPQSY